MEEKIKEKREDTFADTEEDTFADIALWKTIAIFLANALEMKFTIQAAKELFLCLMEEIEDFHLLSGYSIPSKDIVVGGTIYNVKKGELTYRTKGMLPSEKQDIKENLRRTIKSILQSPASEIISYEQELKKIEIEGEIDEEDFALIIGAQSKIKQIRRSNIENAAKKSTENGVEMEQDTYAEMEKTAQVFVIPENLDSEEDSAITILSLDTELEPEGEIDTYVPTIYDDLDYDV